MNESSICKLSKVIIISIQAFLILLTVTEEAMSKDAEVPKFSQFKPIYMYYLLWQKVSINNTFYKEVSLC